MLCALKLFMNTLFRQGAFKGSTPEQAYFIRCDKETTMRDDINCGIVNIVVGFAPLMAAEFIVVRLEKTVGQKQA
jgi:phage tail sheath protein FI